ncbi:MAG TPA: hypothetical protein VE085_12250 [Burkholderiales bacterium]|nr:hypothetical protein [Burkholderiales bacterium]
MENREIVLKTKFWRNAAASLPEGVRSRYLADIAQAERLELALDGAIEALARTRANLFAAPRSAH